MIAGARSYTPFSVVGVSSQGVGAGQAAPKGSVSVKKQLAVYPGNSSCHLSFLNKGEKNCIFSSFYICDKMPVKISCPFQLLPLT